MNMYLIISKRNYGAIDADNTSNKQREQKRQQCHTNGVSTGEDMKKIRK